MAFIAIRAKLLRRNWVISASTSSASTSERDARHTAQCTERAFGNFSARPRTFSWFASGSSRALITNAGVFDFINGI